MHPSSLSFSLSIYLRICKLVLKILLKEKIINSGIWARDPNLATSTENSETGYKCQIFIQIIWEGPIGS